MGCGSSREVIDIGRASSDGQSQFRQRIYSHEHSTHPDSPAGPASDLKSTSQQGSGSRKDLQQPEVELGSIVFEQLLFIDDAAKLFHRLNDHYRSIVAETSDRERFGVTPHFEQLLESTFGVVLQFCETITKHFGSGQVSTSCDGVVTTFAHTTISFMSAKTIIDMYDLILHASEVERWYIADEDEISARSEGKCKQARELTVSPVFPKYDGGALFRFQERMETMDFHIVHIEAVCRRVKDVSFLVSKDLAARNMNLGSKGQAEGSMLSQRDANEQTLVAAQSTRKQIRRIREAADHDSSPLFRDR